MDTMLLSKTLTWVAIAICISQSAIFSGMNLAVFSISRLRLEVEVAAKNRDAQKLLNLRGDTNFLLTTILWGNVGVNVLLALLSNSVMTGLVAFLFSTVVITFVGEILPQAYFSRHAIKMAAKLSWLLNFYKILLFPVAKPSAKMLDYWLGSESIHYFREHDLRQIIKLHMEADEADVDKVEGAGAINFLAFDDLVVTQEGEIVNPESIIALPAGANGNLVFPNLGHSADDPFLKQVERSGKKWVILTDAKNQPHLALDADGFLRSVIFRNIPCNPLSFCHRPVIVYDENKKLGDIIQKLKACPGKAGDDVIDQDIILLWSDTKRVITGADMLGRLLRGIVSDTCV